MKPRWQTTKFTLIESLVAMAILALVGGSSYGGLLMAYRMINSARLHQEAQALAMDRLLEVFHQDYDDVVNEPDVNTETVPDHSALHGMGGTVRTAVSHMGAYCLITVRVDWNDVGLGGSSPVGTETARIRRYDTEL